MNLSNTKQIKIKINDLEETERKHFGVRTQNLWKTQKPLFFLQIYIYLWKYLFMKITL